MIRLGDELEDLKYRYELQIKLRKKFKEFVERKFEIDLYENIDDEKFHLRRESIESSI